MPMSDYHLFIKHLPKHSVDYCFELWENELFEFKIKNKRASKLGDYRYEPTTKKHTISVNKDLNPYSFLITYLHEVAHMHVFLQHGRRAKPHGIEWKNQFKKLMIPMLNSDVFPDDILRKIASYIKNPKASSCNDHELTAVLSKYDSSQEGIFLNAIPHGEVFYLGNRIFKKETLRRTRFICVEIKSGKKYLISKSARVLLP